MLFSTIAIQSLLGNIANAASASSQPTNLNTRDLTTSGNANQPAQTSSSGVLNGVNTVKGFDTSNIQFDQGIADKAQQVIDKFRMKNDLPALISGTDVAKASAAYNIDPKLILAQGLNETHFGTNPAAKRALKFNSAFGVGSYDNGSQGMAFANGSDATMYYANLLRKNYLGDKKTVDDLLNNYVNLKGQRYASDPNYEIKLKSTISKFSSFGL